MHSGKVTRWAERSKEGAWVGHRVSNQLISWRTFSFYSQLQLENPNVRKKLKEAFLLILIVKLFSLIFFRFIALTKGIKVKTRFTWRTRSLIKGVIVMTSSALNISFLTSFARHASSLLREASVCLEVCATTINHTHTHTHTQSDVCVCVPT